MKNQSSEQTQRTSQRHCLKPQNPSTPSLKVCSYILSCSFLLLCLAIQNGRAETAPKKPNTANIPESHPSSSLLIAKSPTTQLERKLWQTRISNPEDKDSNKSKNELQQLIERIRSVKFKLQESAPEPPIVIEPAPKTEPNEALSATEVPETTEAEPQTPSDSEQNNESQPSYKPVTKETLQIYKDLSQHPEQLINPLELAEMLFRSGYLKEAAKCYKEALNRTAAGETDQNQNRAWILFQTGNCLRNDDPAGAIEIYKQLITEYPDLLWSDLAKARTELINWYRQDKPRALIEENQF